MRQDKRQDYEDYKEWKSLNSKLASVIRIQTAIEINRILYGWEFNASKLNNLYDNLIEKMGMDYMNNLIRSYKIV